jgi:hypothetical protein
MTQPDPMNASEIALGLTKEQRGILRTYSLRDGITIDNMLTMPLVGIFNRDPVRPSRWKITHLGLEVRRILESDDATSG